jgi:hypothetical protein
MVPVGLHPPAALVKLGNIPPTEQSALKNNSRELNKPDRARTCELSDGKLDLAHWSIGVL